LPHLSTFNMVFDIKNVYKFEVDPQDPCFD